ncbi:MAG TPA: S8 family serine peptidase [Vineibacter sp.]|nr:S8 family serine peptidase [Vineibacter sp.]
MPGDGKRFLLKVADRPGPAVARSLGLAGTAVKLEPLFDVPAAAAPALGLASDQTQRWYLAEAKEAPPGDTPWDAAHRFIASQLEAQLNAPVLEIEPDIEQVWQVAPPGAPTGAPFAAADPCAEQAANGDLPNGPGFAWYLRDDFSGLKAARDRLLTGEKRSVTIAHIDTGYDAAHATRPEFLDTDRQRNFVDEDAPNDARDRTPSSGFPLQRGHGTGTLGILAGNRCAALNNDYLGGAPRCKVVPIRVANSVLHFWTSAVAKAFNYAREINADVLSMSMGGIASSAWADAVNAAYEAGMVMVCAAGNNFSDLPTSQIVYPARFHRVIAACGIMADRRPYYDLPLGTMQGNWGPSSKMRTAMAAFTPNMPWPKLGCGAAIDSDGAGTSSATPQIAAAAALWLAMHSPSYPEGWMRVEAVRKALFDTADPTAQELTREEAFDRLGHGSLQADKALGMAPMAAHELRRTERDSASFSFLRLLTGLGVEGGAPIAAMLNLELTQLLSQNRDLQRALADPGPAIGKRDEGPIEALFDAVLNQRLGSAPLREALERRRGANRPRAALISRPSGLAASTSAPVVPERQKAEVPVPPHRRLRVFALDPSFSTQLSTAFINQATINVPWERNDTSNNLLQPGPVGEYLEIVDIDPASGAAYMPVDLNDPYLLAQDGLAPSEGNPQFHQQMVYAVAMTTIRHFERALGRVALWRPYRESVEQDLPSGEKGVTWYERYVQRLRIYPHALRGANAFYSPVKRALLFGYFPAADTAGGSQIPRGLTFTCLSHDIIAHETTHALLDGLHRRFEEASNPDVLAFHEAFADIVAIFQHFTLPSLLRYEIARTRSDLSRGKILSGLAQQFGQARGGSQALRDALKFFQAEDKEKRASYADAPIGKPHERGAILVAAVFEGFLAIYRRRTEDLIRLATGGTGRLPDGAIHPDLVERLADEASKSARHVLAMCIRALDYCPPVDITFGEYLRALVTADYDLVPEDKLGYRVAFVEAFRAFGIYPRDVKTLSVESLLWRSPSKTSPMLAKGLGDITLEWDLDADRREAFIESKRYAAMLHGVIRKIRDRTVLADLGIEESIKNAKGNVRFEIHSVRPARRVAPDGSFRTDLVVVITQKDEVPLDPAAPKGRQFTIRGGSTLIVDMDGDEPRIRYSILKRIHSETRIRDQRQFRFGTAGASLHSMYFGLATDEPFALLHQDL